MRAWEPRVNQSKFFVNVSAIEFEFPHTQHNITFLDYNHNFYDSTIHHLATTSPAGGLTSVINSVTYSTHYGHLSTPRQPTRPRLLSMICSFSKSPSSLSSFILSLFLVAEKGGGVRKG